MTLIPVSIFQNHTVSFGKKITEYSKNNSHYIKPRSTQLDLASHKTIKHRSTQLIKYLTSHLKQIQIKKKKKKTKTKSHSHISEHHVIQQLVSTTTNHYPPIILKHHMIHTSNPNKSQIKKKTKIYIYIYTHAQQWALPGHDLATVAPTHCDLATAFHN